MWGQAGCKNNVWREIYLSPLHSHPEKSVIPPGIPPPPRRSQTTRYFLAFGCQEGVLRTPETILGYFLKLSDHNRRASLNCRLLWLVTIASHYSAMERLPRLPPLPLPPPRPPSPERSGAACCVASAEERSAPLPCFLTYDSMSDARLLLGTRWDLFTCVLLSIGHT